MASWLPVVVIVLAIALVIGPVMWLKPSSRDRRLAALRQAAASAGLKVQIQSLPASQGEGNAAVYFSQWRNPRRLQTGWVLELQRMSHEMHFDGVWDWRKGRKAPQPAHRPLTELLEKLPADATAIFASDSGLGVQWRERSDQDGLKRIQLALAELRPLIEEAIRESQRGDGQGGEGTPDTSGQNRQTD